jgi:hypothetical protein
MEAALNLLEARFDRCYELMSTIDRATSILGRDLCRFNLQLLAVSERGIPLDQELYDQLLQFNEMCEFVRLGQRFSVELFAVASLGQAVDVENQ